MTVKKLDVAPTAETSKRWREVQLLINIAEPDPEFQPSIVTDEASLLDCVGTSPDDITKRLNAYFDDDLGLDLGLPVWRIVDAIRRKRPAWPDNPGT